ncbi:efflux RND transporter permease subunit [Lignipirellula cremea]|uniref:Multidrug resistance protein MdtB n=1 Tax=Lignipirellula cremea TaxID=2528010 RepID=A0A518DXB1_9BACT|nr:efflux RND transporter permease subunit [Lignipirellula cremea]QDU96475.1 Multidrug resistance protein MdtB [Lignipirellula cremea]
MQWLAEVCVRRPVFAVMLIVALVVAGSVSYMQLGVDRYPNIDMPTVRVWASYPGSASAEVESEVTQVLEDAVATVAGLREQRSITNDGACVVFLTFELERDIDTATQDVRDAVASVLSRLPPGIDPPIVRKQDLDDTPIMSLVVSGDRSGRELFFLADRYVKSVIESARGVGEVEIKGATDRAIQVNIEADRLAAHRLSIIEVRQALVTQNAEIPGGRVDAGSRELSLRTLGRVPSAREFNDLVVNTIDGVPVRIADLGEALDLQKEIRTAARFDGQPAVVLEIQRQSGENTVEVIEAIKERLSKAQELLPADVQINVLQDQSRYIHAAMHEIQNHLVTGSILASIVVLLFMRSWRSTLIAAVAIPTSIIGAFAVMKALDFSLNNVTMLALVLMVGVVIDDAIVVLENVFRMIEEKGLPPVAAAIRGTREIGMAVLATTLSLVIVFLPVSFLSSVTGRLLFQFGITATVAILISMLVSFTLTPMMCSRMLRPAVPVAGGTAGSRRGFYGLLESSYMLCLRLSLRFRWAVVAVALVVMASNVPLYSLVKQDYIPTNVDEGEFQVRIYAPEGATPSAMERVLDEVETEIRSIEGITHVLSTIGAAAGSIRSANSAQLYVQLENFEQRTFSLSRLWKACWQGDPAQAFAGNYNQRVKMQAVRNVFRDQPELRASVRNLTSFRQGAPVDIDFITTGPSLKTLAEYSDRLREKASQIPGIVDADTTLRIDKPNLLAHIDRERAAVMGVDIQAIAETLRIAVGGDDRVSRFYDDQADDAYDVELRLVGVDRGDPASISQLYVPAQSPANSLYDQPLMSGLGASDDAVALTRLDNLVRFEEGYSPSRIDRFDRQRMVAVRANVDSGYALADRLTALRAAAVEVGLPPGYSNQVLGRGRELEETLDDFFWTLLLSFVFMYIVLAAQYEHFIHPLTILLSLPIAVPFGLFSLWLGGETLNLFSALGILVLFGVVKKAAILQIDHMNQLRQDGMPRDEAIFQANRDRLRPILMTAISFIAGMLPLLIATGPGAEERRSIAVLVVGGQTLSLLLTLVAVPVFYSIFDDFGNLFYRAPAAREEEPAAEEDAELAVAQAE